MANIEFNGIQIDAEEVRAKLAEHERQKCTPEPQWPVWISDGSGASFVINQYGGMYFNPGIKFGSGYFLGLGASARYFREVIRAVVRKDGRPPIAPAELLRDELVKYGCDGTE